MTKHKEKSYKSIGLEAIEYLEERAKANTTYVDELEQINYHASNAKLLIENADWTRWDRFLEWTAKMGL